MLRCEAIAAADQEALRLGCQVSHTILVHREGELPIPLEERFVDPRGVLTTDFARLPRFSTVRGTVGCLSYCPFRDMIS